MKVPYLNGTENPTADRMNTLFGELNRRMVKILGGRSPALAIKVTGFQTATSGGHTTFSYTGVPYSIFGKCFFFTSGRTTYAPNIPGALPITLNVADPLTGVMSSQPGTSPYDHSVFTNALASTSVVTYDDNWGGVIGSHVAIVNDVDASYYQPSQYLWKTVGVSGGNVSLFDHSLQCHTITHPTSGVKYYVKENGAAYPEKRYDLSLAELFIEGPSTVLFKEAWDKYKCFRIHNLNSFPVTFTFENATAYTLTPFQCITVRRDKPSGVDANYRRGLDYFLRFEVGDPRFFWFWPGVPSKTAGTFFGNVYNTVNATAGMQGNNLSNPAVIYDWISWLTQDETGVYCGFERDPHELCDLTERYRSLYVDPLEDENVIGDLFTHKGEMLLAKLYRTANDPLYPSVSKVDWIKVPFKGWSTFASDMALATNNGVRFDSPSGDLRIASFTDPLYFWQLHFTNSNLGHFFYIALNAVAFDAASSFNYTGFSLFGPFTFGDARVFESGSSGQDVNGVGVLNGFSKTCSYRIFQRSLTSQADTRTWFAPQAITYPMTPTSVTTDPISITSEKPLGPQKVMNGIHTRPIRELLNLSFCGDSRLSVQSDTVVTYDQAAILYTPEGVVMKFRERVPFSYLPALPAPSTGSPRKTSFVNGFGRSYSLSIDGLYWEMKHVVRFRGHGFGWGQHGREFAAWLSPNKGRFNGSGLTDEIVGADGKDFGIVDPQSKDTGVNMVRRISARLDLMSPKNGGRFFLMGYKNLDGASQVLLNHDTRGIGGFGNQPWYQYAPPGLPSNATLSLNTNSDVQRTVRDGIGMVMLPLWSEHYNGMAQAVNQLKEGRALDWRAIRIVWGSRVIDFSTLTTVLDESVTYANDYGFEYQHVAGDIRKLPAPVDAFCRVDTVTYDFFGSKTYNPGFKEWFQSRSVPITVGCDSIPLFTDAKNRDNERRPLNINLHFEGLWTYDPRRIAEPIAFAETRHITSSTPAFGTVVAGERGMAAFCVPYVPDELSFTASRYRVFLPDPTLKLSGYDAIEWITINDFKALMTTLGIPFTYTEVFYPLQLDEWNMPTTLINGNVAESNRGNVDTFRNGPDAYLPGAYGYPVTLTYDAIVSPFVDNRSDHGNPWQIPFQNPTKILTKVTAFGPSIAGPSFKWPIQLRNANDPFALLDQVWKRDNDRTANRGRFAIDYAMRVDIYNNAFPPAFEAQASNTNDRDNGYPWRTADTDIWYRMELGDGDASYDRFCKWRFNEELSIAVRIVSTDTGSPSQKVYLAPIPTTGRVPDWWRSSSDNWFWQIYGFTNYSYPGAEPFRAINPGVLASGTTVVAPANQTTIIRPPGNDQACRVTFLPKAKLNLE